MFTRAELDYMQATQEAHMMDTCVIYRVVERTKSTRGESIRTFDEGTGSICGVQMEPLSREYGEGIVESNIDVILRLPLSVTVEPGDEIEIIKRFGEAVEPRRYEVDRFTNDGPSGCRAYLKVRNV